MDFVGDQNYTLCRRLLESVALWPYQKVTWLRRVQKVFLTAILINGSIVQLNTCVTTECNTDHLLKIFPYVMVTVVFALKYITFQVYSSKYKELLERVRYDWNGMTDENELKILQEYTSYAVFYIKMFALVMAPGPFLILLNQLAPVILDVIVPLNETRRREFSIYMEYFIDDQKYFYVPIIHSNIVIFAGVITVLSTESFMVLLSYHACGLFKIVSYRIQNLIPGDISLEISTGKEDHVIYERIVSIISLHKRGVEFVNFMLSTMSAPYFVLLIVGIAAMTFSLFRLHQAILFVNEISMEEFANAVVNICVDLIYLFYPNYVGQQLIDVTSNIFHDVYNTQWYTVSKPVQKLLIFFMQRNIDNCAFVVCHVFTASFEGFSALIRVSLSYFMFIRSTR